MAPDALALAYMTAISTDVLALKQAIEFARRGKNVEATQIEKSIREPMIKRLIEWVILRSEEPGAGFDRYAAFIRDNPAWPSQRYCVGVPRERFGRRSATRPRCDGSWATSRRA
jgi:soluble lytic murein transglycosylase